LSCVLQLLREHGAEIDKYQVDATLLDRLDASPLREPDLRKIDGAKPVRPMRWYDYLLPAHREAGAEKTLWSALPPVVPVAIIDPRLMDPALGFWNDPDALLTELLLVNQLFRLEREAVAVSELDASGRGPQQRLGGIAPGSPGP
jgi:hypothetical protein